jgi:hypothetical protein
MRGEIEIKNLIIDLATKDDRIRTVLLNGSRANPNIQPDKLQDFDLVFIVNDLESFTRDHSWRVWHRQSYSGAFLIKEASILLLFLTAKKSIGHLLFNINQNRLYIS